MLHKSSSIRYLLQCKHRVIQHHDMITASWNEVGGPPNPIFSPRDVCAPQVSGDRYQQPRGRTG